MILFIRTNKKDSFSVSINGSALQQINADYPRLYDKLTGIKEPQHVTAFIVPANVVIQGNNKIVFSASANELILQRVELALKYGSVEECGYF